MLVNYGTSQIKECKNKNRFIDTMKLKLGYHNARTYSSSLFISYLCFILNCFQLLVSMAISYSIFPVNPIRKTRVISLIGSACVMCLTLDSFLLLILWGPLNSSSWLTCSHIDRWHKQGKKCSYFSQVLACLMYKCPLKNNPKSFYLI